MSKLHSHSREWLLTVHKAICEEAHTIMAIKNEAYAGEDSLFRNFELAEKTGLCKTEVGILVRIQDKLSRLVTFFVWDGQDSEGFAEETHLDSIHDLINYLVLLEAYRVSRKSDLHKEAPGGTV